VSDSTDDEPIVRKYSLVLSLFAQFFLLHQHVFHKRDCKRRDNDVEVLEVGILGGGEFFGKDESEQLKVVRPLRKVVAQRVNHRV